MTTQADEQQIKAHYGLDNLTTTLLSALSASGKNLDELTSSDLAPVDQFHIGGKEATLALAQLAEVRRDMNVLDAGGGIGGPARLLATEIGCQVTVLDLTDEYCQAGTDLTQHMGLAESVQFIQGNALTMPFPDASFDLVWTQHMSMNIADKEELYAEIFRVLRPGGKFALHEVMAGSTGPIHFPVPWAREAALSFVSPAQEVQALITSAGFKEVAWADVSATALSWFRTLAAAATARPTPAHIGLNLLLGPQAGVMARNFALNLEEKRVVVMQGVFIR